MSVQLLDKTRKINKLLHNNNSSKVVFNDICDVLTGILESNVLVISRKGKVLGTGLCKGVEEIKGIQLPEDFLFEIGRSSMETDEIRAIIDAFKEIGYASVMVSDYFKGKLSRDESKRVEGALLANMKKYYPGKDDDTLYERLGVMRMASRNDSKLEDIYSDKITEDNMEKIAKDPKYVEEL